MNLVSQNSKPVHRIDDNFLLRASYCELPVHRIDDNLASYQSLKKTKLYTHHLLTISFSIHKLLPRILQFSMGGKRVRELNFLQLQFSYT